MNDKLSLLEALQKITELDCSFEMWPRSTAVNIAEAALTKHSSTVSVLRDCCCNASWLGLDQRDCPLHNPQARATIEKLAETILVEIQRHTGHGMLGEEYPLADTLTAFARSVQLQEAKHWHFLEAGKHDCASIVKTAREQHIYPSWPRGIADCERIVLLEGLKQLSDRVSRRQILEDLKQLSDRGEL